MKMKRTKHDLKREFKREIFILKSAIKAWCYGCNGYGEDAFEDCTGVNCPLYAYKVSRGDRLSKKYKAVFCEMDKLNKENSEIGRGHWERFFNNENLATKSFNKKTNLSQKGGGVND